VAEFWRNSGDAVITGSVALLTMFGAWLVELSRRRSDRRDEHQRWLRDRRAGAIVDVMAAARELRRRFEHARLMKNGSMAAVRDGVEVAFTEVRWCVDAARLLPDGGDQELVELDDVCFRLTLAIRHGMDGVDQLRTEFDHAMDAVLLAGRRSTGAARRAEVREGVADWLVSREAAIA
jgi:hypothetical protein